MRVDRYLGTRVTVIFFSLSLYSIFHERYTSLSIFHNAGSDRVSHRYRCFPSTILVARRNFHLFLSSDCVRIARALTSDTLRFEDETDSQLEKRLDSLISAVRGETKDKLYFTTIAQANISAVARCCFILGFK